MERRRGTVRDHMDTSQDIQTVAIGMVTKGVEIVSQSSGEESSILARLKTSQLGGGRIKK